MNRIFITLPACLLFSIISFTQPVEVTGDSLSGKKFSPEQLKADFVYLRNILEKTHPGLYRYTPKPVMQQKMDSIAALLDKDMSYYDYYALISAFMADIRCAHTYVVPQQDIGSYMTAIKTIPFELMPLNGRLYITLNGTKDQTIQPGAELLTINGRPVESALEQIYRHTWSDGYIRGAKVHKAMGLRLVLLYYLFVERPDSFRLEVLDRSGQRFSITVAARPHKEYSKIYHQNPVNKAVLDIYLPRNKKDNADSWWLEFPAAPNTACLVLRGFGKGNSSETAAKKMEDFMEKSLATIRKKGVRNLVVDLRSNSGGWDIQGVELLRYLIQDSLPFRYFSRGFTVTDSSEYLRFSDLSALDLANVKKELIPNADGTFELSEDYNEERKVQRPRPNRFKGNIYFLINGGTASAAAEFTAVAYSHHTGTFIGTETAGAYEGGNGGSFLHFYLPNSRFYVGSPLIYSENAVEPRAEKGRGTIPHHVVLSTIEDILSGRDAQMEFVLKMIGER